MPDRKILGLILMFSLMMGAKAFSQDDPSDFHQDQVISRAPFQEAKGRLFKTSIDAGMVIGFSGVSGIYSNYVNGVSAKLGYAFGLVEEIPFQRSSYLDIGVEILQSGLSFNSYFFSPDASTIYNGVEPYTHDITMNEIQVPVLFKFALGPTDRKLRSMYMTAGLKFRYISFTNSTVTNDSTGYLTWEGNKDVTSLYKLFSPFGNAIAELSIGYQRNARKKKRRGWYMNLEYNYGLSPLEYSGNRAGSNYVVFRLNSLIFKVGKIF
jgi:Outer membrane protein beta-barrel domain